MLRVVTFLLSLLTYSCWGAPVWLNAPERGCSKAELCAVGSGASRALAEGSARAALSAIFSTKIDAHYKQEVNALGAEVTDSISEKIERSTEMVLEGSIIREFFTDDTDVYALAVLNRHKAAAQFKRDIEQIDEKLSAFWQQQNAQAIRQISKLMIEREALNRRYAFLTGFSLPGKLNFKEVLKSKRDVMSRYVIHVFVDEQEPKKLSAKIAELLSGEGFRVTTGSVRSKQATHQLTGVLDVERLYLKVAGFKKFKFLLKLKSANLKGKSSGAVMLSAVVTGRNYQQAYEKAVKKLLDDLENNIDKLSFD